MVCGNDMALLELNDVIAPSEAPTVTPVVQYSITDHTRYSTTITAIGYGLDSPSDTTSSGQRRIRQNINLQCIPGDASIDCGSLTGTQLTVNEFASGDGTCEGDSGSSAYEQKLFTSGSPVSFGVLSRGGSTSTTCIGGIYTRTDKWKDFIVQNALQAAKDGSYTAPAWTQAPLPDGGAPPAPGTGQLGDACADNTDCASSICQSLDGQTYICTQGCDGSAGSCPAGYSCQQSYCFPAPKPTSGGGTRTVITKSGCSVDPVGPDPTKPVPWRTGVAMAVVALAIARRRRPFSSL
jgi:MYXO-CTERM domain-containing protein